MQIKNSIIYKFMFVLLLLIHINYGFALIDVSDDFPIDDTSKPADSSTSQNSLAIDDVATQNSNGVYEFTDTVKPAEGQEVTFPEDSTLKVNGLEFQVTAGSKFTYKGTNNGNEVYDIEGAYTYESGDRNLRIISGQAEISSDGVTINNAKYVDIDPDKIAACISEAETVKINNKGEVSNAKGGTIKDSCGDETQSDQTTSQPTEPTPTVNTGSNPSGNMPVNDAGSEETVIPQDKIEQFMQNNDEMVNSGQISKEEYESHQDFLERLNQEQDYEKQKKMLQDYLNEAKQKGYTNLDELKNWYENANNDAYQSKPTAKIPEVTFNNAENIEFQPAKVTIGSADNLDSDKWTIVNGEDITYTPIVVSTGKAEKVILKDIEGTDFKYQNVEQSVMYYEDGKFKASFTSGDGNSSLSFPNIDINFTGNIRVEVDGDIVNITGGNVTASTGKELVIGETSIITIIGGEMFHTAIKQYSRYEYLGNEGNCREGIALYNPIDEWHQIYLIKSDDQYYSTTCDYCSYFNFLNNSLTINNKLKVERKSAISLGWDRVIESNCDDNKLYLQMDECFDKADMEFHYDGIISYDRWNRKDSPECLEVNSHVFYIKQFGVKQYVNILDYPKDYFIKSYDSPYGSKTFITEKELKNDFIVFNAPYDPEKSDPEDNMWTRLMDDFDEIIDQIGFFSGDGNSKLFS